MPSCVPVPPVTATVNIENSLLERQQLPLMLAWALTIHKSQGMTLEKAWIDIGKKETTLGMTYVAISRVRNLLSLIIEPMTFDRLTSLKKNGTLQYRLTEEKRLKAIASLSTCYDTPCVSHFFVCATMLVSYLKSYISDVKVFICL